jgi:tetratricopeptide (TPR) repeat protein
LRAALAAAVFLAAAPAALAAAPHDFPAQRDALLLALRSATDEDTARLLEGRLHELWRSTGSPSSILLLDRASREMQAGSPEDAIDDADAVLVLDPDYVAAFETRAAARLMAGDATGALHDAAEVLRREPQHVGALMLVSRAAESRGDMTAAYDAWQKVMELDPKTPSGQARLNDLHRRAVGENI